MSPAPCRASGKSAPKAKTQAKARRELVAVMDHADHHEQEAIPHTKRLRNWSSDDLTNKKIRMHFKGWTQEQTHVHCVNGKSLFQTIKDDSKKSGDDNVPMGKHYYNEKRVQFLPENAPERLLKTNDPDEVVDAGLLVAPTALNKHRRSYEELMHGLESVGTVSQRDYVALARQVTKLGMQSNSETCSLVVAVMKMIKKLGLHVSFRAEFEVIFCQLDKATVKTIDMCNRNIQTSQQWWKANQEWASLILPEEATDTCMEEQKSLRKTKAPEPTKKRGPQKNVASANKFA